MKILAISDIHGRFPEVPKGDILCIAGDISPSSNHSSDYQKKWMDNNFLPWCEAKINKGVVKHIVFVAGNHDLYLEDLFMINRMGKFKEKLHPNIHYLQDEMVEIEGIKIYGTPFQPEFCDWAFNRTEKELEPIFEKIPEGLDVLISHGPPMHYCDQVEGRYEYLGSSSLERNIIRAKPRLTVCGHIHTGCHNLTQVTECKNDKVEVVNVSLLDERYQVFFEVFEMDL